MSIFLVTFLFFRPSLCKLPTPSVLLCLLADYQYIIFIFIFTDNFDFQVHIPSTRYSQVHHLHPVLMQLVHLQCSEQHLAPSKALLLYFAVLRGYQNHIPLVELQIPSLPFSSRNQFYQIKVSVNLSHFILPPLKHINMVLLIFKKKNLPCNHHLYLLPYFSQCS